MDLKLGYNRGARKTLHIIGGLFALLLPWLALCPFGIPLALAAAALAVIGSWWLRPDHARWLRYISKPADRNRKVITGLRGYAVVVALLLISWPLLGRLTPDGLRIAMYGWLALAWADGLAGMLGPSPGRGRTVPWNNRKTWWGLFGAFVGALVAFAVAFLAPWPGLPVASFNYPMLLGLLISIPVALVESVKTKIDDNYLVGLGAPSLALLALLLGA